MNSPRTVLELSNVIPLVGVLLLVTAALPPPYLTTRSSEFPGLGELAPSTADGPVTGPLRALAHANGGGLGSTIGPFTATLSAVVTGGTAPYNCMWDYGDGSRNGTGTSTVHLYPDAGEFLVVFVATDAAGGRASSTLTINVFKGTIPLSSEAQVIPQIVTAGPGGTPVTFSMILPPGNIHRYHWNFGDGQNSSAASPSHTYLVPGEYLVELAVEFTANYVGTPAGSFWNSSENLTVLAVAPGSEPPFAVVANVFNASFPECQVATGVATFTPTVVGGRAPYRQEWTFGDGASGSSSGSTAHSYAGYSPYQANMTVFDADNYTSSATSVILWPSVPASVGSNQCPPGPTTYLVGAVLVVAVGLVVAVAIVVRRRRRRPLP